MILLLEENRNAQSILKFILEKSELSQSSPVMKQVKIY